MLKKMNDIYILGVLCFERFVSLLGKRIVAVFMWIWLKIVGRGMEPVNVELESVVVDRVAKVDGKVYSSVSSNDCVFSDVNSNVSNLSIRGLGRGRGRVLMSTDSGVKC